MIQQLDLSSEKNRKDTLDFLNTLNTPLLHLDLSYLQQVQATLNYPMQAPIKNTDTPDAYFVSFPLQAGMDAPYAYTLPFEHIAPYPFTGDIDAQFNVASLRISHPDIQLSFPLWVVRTKADEFNDNKSWYAGFFVEVIDNNAKVTLLKPIEALWAQIKHDHPNIKFTADNVRFEPQFDTGENKALNGFDLVGMDIGIYNFVDKDTYEAVAIKPVGAINYRLNGEYENIDIYKNNLSFVNYNNIENIGECIVTLKTDATIDNNQIISENTLQFTLDVYADTTNNGLLLKGDSFYTNNYFNFLDFINYIKKHKQGAINFLDININDEYQNYILEYYFNGFYKNIEDYYNKTQSIGDV